MDGGSGRQLSGVAAVEPRGATAPLDDCPATALNAPVLVVTQAVSRDVNPRASAWGYITEVLRRAGLFFEELPPERLPWLLRRPNAIVLLAGDLPLTAAQRQVLATWVGDGGALVGIGGTSGLDEVFGVTDARRLAEGWIKVTAQDHPLTAGLRSSLHVFGGYAVKPASATSLAELELGQRRGERQRHPGKPRRAKAGPFCWRPICCSPSSTSSKACRCCRTAKPRRMARRRRTRAS